MHRRGLKQPGPISFLNPSKRCEISSLACSIPAEGLLLISSETSERSFAGSTDGKAPKVESELSDEHSIIVFSPGVRRRIVGNSSQLHGSPLIFSLFILWINTFFPCAAMALV